jgi:hypothetical protein
MQELLVCPVQLSESKNKPKLWPLRDFKTRTGVRTTHIPTTDSNVFKHQLNKQIRYRLRGVLSSMQTQPHLGGSQASSRRTGASRLQAISLAFLHSTCLIPEKTSIHDVANLGTVVTATMHMCEM